jgi:hypothetical protein
LARASCCSTGSSRWPPGGRGSSGRLDMT